MTEKRFEIDMGRECLKDNEKELSTIYFSDSVDFYELCEVLNALHEENQRLKSRITYLEWKIERERASHQKQHEKWDKEAQNEINEIMKLLKSYQKTVKHSAKLLADATKNGYLPPLEDWEEL